MNDEYVPPRNPLVEYDERFRCACPVDRRTAPCWRKATQEDMLCDRCREECFQ